MCELGLVLGLGLGLGLVVSFYYLLRCLMRIRGVVGW